MFEINYYNSSFVYVSGRIVTKKQIKSTMGPAKNVISNEEMESFAGGNTQNKTIDLIRSQDRNVVSIDLTLLDDDNNISKKNPHVKIPLSSTSECHGNHSIEIKNSAEILNNQKKNNEPEVSLTPCSSIRITNTSSLLATQDTISKSKVLKSTICDDVQMDVNTAFTNVPIPKKSLKRKFDLSDIRQPSELIITESSSSTLNDESQCHQHKQSKEIILIINKIQKIVLNFNYYKIYDGELVYKLEKLFSVGPRPNQVSNILYLWRTILQKWGKNRIKPCTNALVELLNSLDNKKDNIIIFIGCLMCIFRRIINLSNIPDLSETFLYFNVFYDVIKKCLTNSVKIFRKKLFKSKYFVDSCYIIDHILHVGLSNIKTMENLVNTNKISSILEFLQSPYNLNCPKIIIKKSNNSFLKSETSNTITLTTPSPTTEEKLMNSPAISNTSSTATLTTPTTGEDSINNPVISDTSNTETLTIPTTGVELMNTWLITDLSYKATSITLATGEELLNTSAISTNTSSTVTSEEKSNETVKEYLNIIKYPGSHDQVKMLSTQNLLISKPISSTQRLFDQLTN